MPPELNSSREHRGITSEAMERRACTRYPIKLSAWYESQGMYASHTGEAITTNLSIGGICLLPDSEIEIGSRIRVWVQWPAAPGAAPLELVGAGTVIRKDWSGVGIKLERKPMFRLRRTDGDEDPDKASLPGAGDGQWSVRQAADSDSPMLSPAASPDRSAQLQRHGPLAIHDTADGLISTTVRKQGERWVGHCWGGRHSYSCDGSDASEALNGVDAFFRTMYPHHVCSPRCYVAPMNDESDPIRLTI